MDGTAWPGRDWNAARHFQGRVSPPGRVEVRDGAVFGAPARAARRRDARAWLPSLPPGSGVRARSPERRPQSPRRRRRGELTQLAASNFQQN